jgi:hypothetical protein
LVLEENVGFWGEFEQIFEKYWVFRRDFWAFFFLKLSIPSIGVTLHRLGEITKKM